MPLYDYECKCGYTGEYLNHMEHYEACPKCQTPMKRVFHSQYGINMGVGAFGYYDENLGTYIHTNRQRREEMKKQGKVSSTKVICCVVVDASETVARNLNVALDSAVIFLERLRFAGEGKPIIIERTYFPFEEYELVS